MSLTRTIEQLREEEQKKWRDAQLLVRSAQTSKWYHELVNTLLNELEEKGKRVEILQEALDVAIDEIATLGLADAVDKEIERREKKGEGAKDERKVEKGDGGGERREELPEEGIKPSLSL